MKKITSLLLGAMLALGLVLQGAYLIHNDGYQVFAEEEQEISIIFTHDMHSHLQPSLITRGGDTQEIGGFPKLKSAMDAIKEEYPNSFIVDGGDFSMGTPYQTIFMTEASELAMMGKLGYDVTTLGNHEFDYRTLGLVAMLNKAASYVGTTTEVTRGINKETGRFEKITTTTKNMPNIVQSNINWKKTLEDDGKKEKAQLLKDAFANYGIEKYTIIEKDGLKMAVFGLLGSGAIVDAPLNGLIWHDGIEEAKKIVKEIKDKGEADIIVCLSHSGLEESQDKGEDVDLAKAVPDIDLIVSGHSHTLLEKPLIVGKTVIVATGEYTKNLGHVVLKKSDNKFKVLKYSTTPLDNKILGDEAIQKEVDEYKAAIDGEYFAQFGYSMDQVLAESDFPFIDISQFAKEQREEPLGNLITDSYIYAVQQAEGEDYDPVAVAVVPAGVVRGSFGQGAITVADVFNVSSLGIGPDGVPGYPIVSIYLTGKELKAMAEVDISVSPSLPEARLSISGLKYSYNNNRLFLNRAIDIKLDKGEGQLEKIDNKKLYRVVGGLYSCQMLGKVEAGSKGLLSVTPKDKAGNEITDFEKQIIYKDGVELKEWNALANYIESFPEGKIPMKYKDIEGRKTDKTNLNPYTLLKQPNNLGIIVYAIALIPIVIIVGIILGLRRRKYRRRGYQKSMFRSKSKPRYGKPVFKERKIRMRSRNSWRKK